MKSLGFFYSRRSPTKKQSTDFLNQNRKCCQARSPSSRTLPRVRFPTSSFVVVPEVPTFFFLSWALTQSSMKPKCSLPRLLPLFLLLLHSHSVTGETDEVAGVFDLQDISTLTLRVCAVPVSGYWCVYVFCFAFCYFVINFVLLFFVLRLCYISVCGFVDVVCIFNVVIFFSIIVCCCVSPLRWLRVLIHFVFCFLG